MIHGAARKAPASGGIGIHLTVAARTGHATCSRGGDQSTRTESSESAVRAANPASLFLPLPTLRGLAARAPPSHLLGARRFHCFCHRKQNNGHAEREIPAPTAIAPRNDALSSHEMERNLGSVWGGTIDLTDETQERATKRQGRVDRLCKAIMEAVPVVGD